MVKGKWWAKVGVLDGISAAGRNSSGMGIKIGAGRQPGRRGLRCVRVAKWREIEAGRDWHIN